MEKSLRQNASFYTINSKTNGATDTVTYRKQLSKDVMDEIDKVLAKHYGFTEEGLDFIINYDIKYRMGDELLKMNKLLPENLEVSKKTPYLCNVRTLVLAIRAESREGQD